MNKKRSKQLDKLLKIEKVEDIKTLTIVDQFEDDHLECANVKINGIEISFMCYDDLGFLTYYKDSKKAFNDLKESIKTQIEIEKDS